MRTSIRLVVGLGNPGRKYAVTRHNVGFVLVDAFAAAREAAWVRKRDFEGQVASVAADDGCEIHLLKPFTFMNECGRSAGAYCRFFRISPPEVVVVFDEINLPFGRAKLSVSGSAGGHNGLASMLDHLGDGFKRLRLGIGPRTPPNIDLKDYVLGKMTPEQQSILKQNMPEFLEGLDLLLTKGMSPAMNRINRRSSSDDDSNEKNL